MFFAPKRNQKKQVSPWFYNPHRTMVSKEFTFDAAHHLFIMKANANHFMVIPTILNCS